MRPAVLGGSPPAPGIFRAYTSNEGPGGISIAAGQFGIVQLHANVASCGAQLVSQIFADRNFDFQRAVRKRFVAALGAHGKRRKFLAANFFPCRAAQRRRYLLRRRAGTTRATA